MRKSQEEKVAEQIADKLDKSTLDLDQVGRYLATMPNLFYNRLMIVAEAAEFEKEARSLRQEEMLF